MVQFVAENLPWRNSERVDCRTRGHLIESECGVHSIGGINAVYYRVGDESSVEETSVKPKPHDLAIFGRPAAFAEPFYFGQPSVDSRECFLERNDDLCNTTISLVSGVRALGLRGEVIVRSLIFTATQQALQWRRVPSWGARAPGNREPTRLSVADGNLS
jgi:hypothetical protein